MQNPEELKGLIELNQRETEQNEAELFGEPEQADHTENPTGQELKDVLGDPEEETDDEECRKLRTDIMLYLCSHRFREFLRKAGFNNAFEKKLENMPKQELQHNMDKIKHLVENRNAGNIYEEMLKTGVAGVETIARPRLDGLSGDINDDEALLDCLEEIRLKYPNLRITSPERRLAILLGMKVFNRYNKNKASNVLIPQAVQNVIANPASSMAAAPKPTKKPQMVGISTEDKDLLSILNKTPEADPTF